MTKVIALLMILLFAISVAAFAGLVVKKLAERQQAAQRILQEMDR